MLRDLSFGQFNSYISWLGHELAGAQLQDVWTNDYELVLEFYKYKNFWLLIELHPQNPDLILLQRKPPIIKKKVKPLGLFLASHARNLRVHGFRSLFELGRVAVLDLGTEKGKFSLTLVLIPGAVNLQAEALSLDGGVSKKISWAKHKELPLVPNPDRSIVESDWSEIEQAWWRHKDQVAVPPKISVQKESRVLDKKKKAEQQLVLSLNETKVDQWRELGEALKNMTSEADYLSLTPDFFAMLDAKLSRAENIERAFQQAKALLRKQAGARQRLLILRAEIEKLERNEVLDQFAIEPAASPTRQRLKKVEAKVRKLVLAPGIEAVCGKSGRDNLAILRQARAWDLWLHLKDYPGAHAIIFVEKNKVVPTEMIEMVSLWLIKESPAAKGFAWGGKYQVVVAEARHVRPIKGDSLGRVTYHHPKSFTFAAKGS